MKTLRQIIAISTRFKYGTTLAKGPFLNWNWKFLNFEQELDVKMSCQAIGLYKYESGL